MPPGRKIIFAPECDAAAADLGGYQRIDRTLDAVMEALYRNPYGFPKQESDWFNFRYIVTKPVGDVPALVWTFTIEGMDVVLRHVEPYDRY